MQSLTLHREFLKKPQNSFLVLFIVVLLAYMTIFTARPDTLAIFLHRASFFYLCKLVLTAILPEIASLLILVALINGYHLLMKLEKVDISLDAIARYEFKFVPLFVMAFFFFFPITLHLRFLLREFPHYTLVSYYNIYLINGFSFNTYLFYLPFIFVLGYTLLNISMFFDFAQKSSSVVAIAVDNIENMAQIEKQNTEPLEEITEIVEDTPNNLYLTVIEAKTVRGTVYFNIQDCYYFTIIGDRQYAVEHPEGRFRIYKSISELEQELDPLHFFKCSRKAIINLNYTGSFVYLDKGKYNVCMKSPVVGEFDITKARIEILKDALKVNVESKKK